MSDFDSMIESIQKQINKVEANIDTVTKGIDLINDLIRKDISEWQKGDLQAYVNVDGARKEKEYLIEKEKYLIEKEKSLIRERESLRDKEKYFRDKDEIIPAAKRIKTVGPVIKGKIVQ